MTITFAPHDWTSIGVFACLLMALFVMVKYDLGRDENLKWQVTTEENRVPAFFLVILIAAAAAILIFGPKAP